MAVFFGPQGTGKSTMAAVIADLGITPLPAILLGGAQHFTDTIMLGDEAKELVLSLAGKLIAEIGEMGTRGKTNAAHVRAMITRQTDSGRTAYARAVSERPRRNIFIGTTNDDEPLTDPTGNRRFLPVRVDAEIDLAWLSANLGQLVGEAAALQSAGQDFAVPRDVWADAAARQEAARAESDVEILLNDWFASREPSPVSLPWEYITCADLVHLSNAVGWRGGDAVRGATMRRLGFRRESIRSQGTKMRVWVRGPDTLPKQIESKGARFVVGADSNGRATVALRAGIPATGATGGSAMLPALGVA